MHKFDNICSGKLDDFHPFRKLTDNVGYSASKGLMWEGRKSQFKKSPELVKGASSWTVHLEKPGQVFQGSCL